MFKKLIASTLLTFSILLHPTTSWAATTDYTFEIDWVIGSLAGTSSTVFVTLDGVTGVGVEDFSPYVDVGGEWIPAGVLEFQTTIGGYTFNREFVGLESFPQVRLTDNNLTSVKYSTPGDTDILLSLRDFNTSTSGLVWNVLFDVTAGEDQNLGFYDFNSWTNVSSVPLPAAAWLFLAALSGLWLAGLRQSGRRQQKVCS